MRRPQPGTYVEVATAGERFCAFVPAPLPPDPPLVWSGVLRRLFDEALLARARLHIISELTNRQRGRVFSYRRYVDELAAELEPAT